MARRKKLKAFTANFNGHWVGGYAVVVADSKEEAFKLLKARLDAMNIRRPHELELDDAIEIDLYTAHSVILSDGEY